MVKKAKGKPDRATAKRAVKRTASSSAQANRIPNPSGPPNIVAMPIIRNAISAFEGAAEILPATAAEGAKKKASAMRREFLRLAALPSDRLLEAYKPPARLNLGGNTVRTVSALLPEAGEKQWAREATGRIAALSFLTGSPVSIKTPPGGVQFNAKEDEAASNREAKARAGAYLQSASEAMLTATKPDAARAAADSYRDWVAEWNRLNAAEIEGAKDYLPALENIQKAAEDLEEVRQHLQEIKAAAELIEAVLRLIALVAPFIA
jgi:hypothetical protein